MPNEVLQKTGTQFSFADHGGDHGPAAANQIEVGTPTDVDLAVLNVANGAAVNSDKFDFGATRARKYGCIAALEFFSATTVGKTVDFYLSGSPNSTAANGNQGKADGVDGAYTGDGGGTVAESVLQMQYVGSFVCTDLLGVQIARIGFVEPEYRYGQLVVVNNSGVALAATDDIECTIILEPVIDEIQ